MKFKMKKNEVWNEKMMFEMKKMKFGETKNEKTWKINENKWKQKNDWKTKWKNEVTNENPNEK